MHSAPDSHTRHNPTSATHPRAPAVLHIDGRLVSASDYGHEKTRSLLAERWLSETYINQIMAGRTLTKLGHGYKEEARRRSGDRYFDHPSGVMLLLLLELGITDPDILAAAYTHDVLEDVKINPREMENLIERATNTETLRITKGVTNPKKTGDKALDQANKIQHYKNIGDDLKTTLLKVGDRKYNLRTLEVCILPDTEITDRHIKSAQDQVDETIGFILPLAKKYGLGETLLEDVERVKQHISRIRLARVVQGTKEKTGATTV